MKEICSRECENECNGTRNCCYYCDYKESCENPCEASPYNCNETMVSDRELLDYVLDKHLNMDKIDLISEYIEKHTTIIENNK